MTETHDDLMTASHDDLMSEDSTLSALRGKRLLLIVGGGVAAYKALETTRRLLALGATSRAILTEAGERFVTPLSLSALSGTPPLRDLFADDESPRGAMAHIYESRESDAIVIVPCTADLAAKMASGIADDLASTTLLASSVPIVAAMAMNPRMWSHPATRRNVERLRADGTEVVNPVEGDAACGEFGVGRLAEIDDILRATARRLTLGVASDRPLAGLRALITAGPTREALDGMRFISNRSTGRQGYALAAAAARLGARTSLISGPTELPIPEGVDRAIRVESAEEMRRATAESLPADVAVCCAAVADWRRRGGPLAGKAEKATALDSIALEATPDIAAEMSSGALGSRPRLVVCFAAESEARGESAFARAAEKRRRKGCDWIAINDAVTAPGGESNLVAMLSGDDADGVELWEESDKSAIADRLMRRAAIHLSGS